MDLAAGVYLTEAQNSIPHCISVYSEFIHTGKGRRGEKLNQRKG
jgi:hypothetical protein